MNKTNRLCPICNSEYNTTLGTLRHVHFDDSSLPREVDIVSCKNCGFVFNNIICSQKELNDYSPKYLNNFNKFNDKSVNLSHILEHIIDLNSMIQNIIMLNKDKDIYIEVPDVSNYYIFSSPLRFFYFSHINHFDVIHLRNLFINNGYIEINSGHIIRKENELSIPSIWSVFHKENENKLSTTNDFKTSNKVKKWLSEEIDNDNILEELSNNNKKIYLWGTGLHVHLILAMSPLRKCINRITFIDNDIIKQKRNIANKNINSADILKNSTKNDVIIIGAPSHSKEIYDHLQKHKIKGKIIDLGFNKICKIQ